MQITIKATQLSLTPDVREYVEKKLGAIAKFLDETKSAAVCDVELEHEHAQHHGPVFRAEVNLNLHGRFYRVEDSAESITAAVDAVHDEIARRLRKGKTKRMSRARRGGAAIKKMMREI